MQRYFALNKNLDLSLDDVHHIVNVMRMKKNDKILVVFDKKTFLCNIDEVIGTDINKSIIEEIKEETSLDNDITIAISLLKEAKFDFVLQKMTELGVDSIIPLKTERSIIKLDNQKASRKKERWGKICKEAAEQSHRNTIPHLYDVLELKDIVQFQYDLKILCSTTEKVTNIKEILQKNKKCVRILVVIGPEGGFTTKEEEYLIENDFIGVTLGNRILRAETAPIFVLSAINYEGMR